MLVFLAAGMVAGALIVPRLAERLSLQMLFLGGVSGFGIAMFGFASVGTLRRRRDVRALRRFWHRDRDRGREHLRRSTPWPTRSAAACSPPSNR